MLDAGPNLLVVVAFGALLGTLVGVFGVLTGVMDIPKQQPGEKFVDAVRRRMSDEQRLLANPPQSASVVTGATFALLAVLILVLSLSPVRMRPLPFAGALLVAGWLIMGASRLVQRSDRSLPGERLLFRLFENQRPKGPGQVRSSAT